jgi:hypothetical protein
MTEKQTRRLIAAQMARVRRDITVRETKIRERESLAFQSGIRAGKRQSQRLVVDPAFMRALSEEAGRLIGAMAAEAMDRELRPVVMEVARAIVKNREPWRGLDPIKLEWEVDHMVRGVALTWVAGDFHVKQPLKKELCEFSLAPVPVAPFEGDFDACVEIRMEDVR